MLVSLQPAITNKSLNYKAQKPSFQSFNEGFYKQAVQDIDVVDNSFYFRVLSREFPLQDYRDTLPRIKEHYFPRFQAALQETINWAEKFQPNQY